LLAWAKTEVEATLKPCSIGNLFCDPEKPIPTATRFRAQIVVFNIDVPITKGFPVCCIEV
jgi:translation elongation factor EF-1alpha